ncbi:MAG: CopD family protein [Verrucomicrobiia bacterium]
MTTECFVLTRAVHFGACLLFFGIFAFDRFVAVSIVARGHSEIADYWQAHIRFFSSVALSIVLLSGIAWFVLVAMTMSGLPLGQTLQPEILKTVWTQTQFGTVWKWRLLFWLAAAAVATLFYFRKSKFPSHKNPAWIQLPIGGLLLGSLAWAGHGQEDSIWHLLADILHLLVAGFWPTGLLPLALLLKRLRQIPEPARWNLIATLVRRFSAMSLVSVALLALTGWVNAWFLVGSFSNLLEHTYGRWLLAKIILFAFAVIIGAVNLLRLKPRLSIEKSQIQTFEATTVQLQCNVHMELAIGMGIVVVVAILGILPPAAH